MWYRFLTLAIVLLFFSLLQGSFLAHLSIFGAVPDLMFITVFLLAFFEKQKDYRGVYLVMLAGLLSDIFSNNFLGLSIVSLIAIYFLIKQARVILTDISNKYPVAHFIPLFILSFIIYSLLLRILILLQGRLLFSYFISYAFLAGIISNLVPGLVVFGVIKLFIGKK